MPQVPAWAEANKPRILEFIALLDGELEDRQFVAGTASRSPISPGSSPSIS